MDRILSGAEDSRLVDVEGVIRNASVSRGIATLDVVCARNRFSAYVPGLVASRASAGRPRRHSWECAGRCTTTAANCAAFNCSCRAPTACASSSRPARPSGVAVDHVLDFAADRLPGHHVRVGGIVTWSSGSLLFIRDADNGLHVGLRGSSQLAPGDRVDVVGYPRAGRLVPVLEDAEVFPNGHGRPPAPVVTSAQELARGLHA